jgi:hypothetical protein
MPDFIKDFQAGLAQSLEAVGTGARLERPAAQDVRPRRLDVAGDGVEYLGALDGARPRDQGQRSAADLRRLDGRLAVGADGDDRVGGMKLPAG